MNILSINLNHCAAASSQLSVIDNILKEPIHVFILQEPYHIKGKIAHINGDWRAVGMENGRTAIVITDSDLEYTVDSLHDCVVAITVYMKQYRLAIISTYFSPAEDLEGYLYQLENVIRTYTYDFMIAGDFNAKNFNWGAREMDQRGILTYDFIVQYSLKILNIQDFTPTFSSSVGIGWTDLAVCSPSMDVSNVSFRVLDLETLSDHKYLFIKLGDVKIERTMQKQYSRNVGRVANMIKKCRNDIFKIEDRIVQASNAEELNEVVKEMEDLLMGYMNKYLLIKKNLNNRKSATWWNTELDGLRRKLRATRKSAQVKNIPEDLRIKRKVEYKRNLAIYKKKIKSVKSQFRERKFLDHKIYYDNYYRIATEKRRQHIILEKGDKKYKTIEEYYDRIIRNTLKLDEDDIDVDEDMIVTQNDEEVAENGWETEEGNLIYCTPFTYEEIYCVISRLSTKSAPGLDMIGANIIKRLFEEYPSLFLIVYNRCLALAVFPECWKIGKIVLIPKNNDKYRPICLLKFFAKILDKLITNRLNYILCKKNYISHRQYGFRRGRSTELALYHTIQLIRQKKIDYHLALISFDIHGAFDAITWPQLLYTLKRIGVYGNLYLLIEDYLHNRRIIYQGSTNKFNLQYQIKKGCPQGSCSAPLFWSLMINEILVELPNTEIICFADDVMVLIYDHSLEKLEQRFKHVDLLFNQWSVRQKIHFNLEKTNAIFFPRGGAQTRPPRIKFKGKNVKFKDEIKYLGVTLDKKLNFISHFKEVQRKIEKVLTFYINTFTSSTLANKSATLREIYINVILPKIIYGVGAWGVRAGELVRLRSKLDSLQRGWLLAITRAFRTVSTEVLCVLAGVPPLSIQYRFYYDKFLLRNKLNESMTYNDTVICAEDITYFNSENISPIEARRINYDCNKLGPQEIEIYTDGSGFEKGVGAAFVVYFYGLEIHSQKFKMKEKNSVYQAEIIAVKEALNWIVKGLANRHCIHIYSDALSVLAALSRPEPKNELLENIKDLYYKAYEKHSVYLHWIKAHIGHCGNERADALAKETALGDGMEYLCVKPSRRKLIATMNDYNHKQWKQEWETSTRRNYYLKDIEVSTKMRVYKDTDVNQIITNHGSYLGLWQRNSRSEACERNLSSWRTLCEKMVPVHVIHGDSDETSIQAAHSPGSEASFTTASTCKTVGGAMVPADIYDLGPLKLKGLCA
ncbi:Hypothetical protein in type-1 retrotransposable element, partial [Stegodyphus mimosarum]